MNNISGAFIDETGELKTPKADVVNWRNYLDGYSLREQMRFFRKNHPTRGIEQIIVDLKHDTIGLKKWAGLCSAHGGEKAMMKKIRDTYKRVKSDQTKKQRGHTARVMARDA